MRVRGFGIIKRTITGLVLAILAAAITVEVHDYLLMRSEMGKEHALWKWWMTAGSYLPKPWRVVPFGHNEPVPPPEEDAIVARGSTFDIPHWVQRQEQDGSWTRRRCTWTYWCEDFDYWHQLRIQIDGEAPVVMDKTDGPTGQHRRLWMNKLFGEG